MSIFSQPFTVRVLLKFIIIGFVISCPDITSGQEPSSDIDPYLISHYSLPQGFPSKTVTDITIGEDGYLYAASIGGLIRMDGHHIDVFSIENVSGLMSSRISKVFSISKSTVIIQDHQGNLYRFQNGRVSALLNPETDQMIESNILRKIDSETWLIVDQNNAYSVTDTSVTVLLGSLSSFPIWDAVYFDERLYVLNTDGLYVSGTSGYTKLEIPEEYKPDLSFFTRIETIDSHFRIIGRQKSACYDVESQSWCPKHSFILEGEQDEIYSIKKYSDGYLIATSTGFYYKSNGQLNRTFQSSEALLYESIFYPNYGQVLVGQDGVWVNDSLVFKPSIRINDAVIDNKGGIWISSSQDGIYHIRKNNFSVFTSPQVVNSYALIKDQLGRFWAGSFENGLIRWKNSQSSVFNRENGSLPSNTVRMISSLNDGGILASVWGEPPVIIRDDSIESLSDFRPLFGNRTNVTESFFEDKTGKFWFGTLQGLFIKEGSRYKTYFDKNGRTISKISKIIPSPFNDELYFCTVDQGVVVLRNNEFHFLSENLPTAAKHVRDIHITSSDTIWALSYNTGIQRFTRSSGTSEFDVVNLSSDFGFDNAGFHRIIQDTTGYFWISTNEGLLNISESGLNQSIEMGKLSTPMRWFTEEDGIIDREFNGGSQNTGFYDAEEHIIWFTNSQGLVSFDPYSFDRTPIEESTFQIQSLVTPDSIVTDFRNRVIIDDRDVSIKYAHIALSDNQTATIWVYRSDSDTWEIPINPGYFELKDLSHGSTTVLFGTSGGSTVIKRLEIFIPPKLYERTSIRLIAGILIGGMVFLFFFLKKKEPILISEVQIPEISSQGNSEVQTVEKSDKIEAFINEHFTESDLDISKISKELGVSRSSLFRMWNESHTLSITDYINKLRLEEAAKQLSSGEYNVTEVAYRCGFSSQSYFTKKFKSMYGYPPSKATSE